MQFDAITRRLSRLRSGGSRRTAIRQCACTAAESNYRRLTDDETDES